MFWLVVLLFLAMLGAFCWLAEAALLSPLRRVADAARQIASGERPQTFVSRGPPPFNSVFRDLEKIWDEQLRLKKQISEEEFSHRAILSGMVEGVMVVDAASVIRLVNESFVKLLGIKTSPLNRQVLDALRETSIDEIVDSVLETGCVQSREISLMLSPPEVSYFAVNAIPLRDPEGRCSGVVGVFHDISRLRQLEEVRRQFVANVSHELRTPLSIVTGYLENLVDNPTMARKEQAEIFKVMERHSVRLGALLDDLLTLARLESRADLLERDVIDLGRFLRQVAGEWKTRLARKKVSLSVEVEPGLRKLTADSFRVEQVLSNLLDNSLKYTPEGGSITITAGESGADIFVRIADTGSGIPTSDLPHIFERFYRVEKARTRESGGTGLGLSIVKHIVVLHGGRVEAASTYGKGTAITFYLPVGPGRPDGQETESATTASDSDSPASTGTAVGAR